MKIVFNGIPEKKGRGGCGACGKRRTEDGFTTLKSYILPSGVTKIFRAGIPEDVTERDAEFLFLFKYVTSSGEEKQVFTEWQPTP